MTEEKIL